MSHNKVHVGTPSRYFKDWSTIEVCFHGFADLSTTRGEHVVSPEFSCFGHQWRVDLLPGGHRVSSDGNVAAYLYNMSNESIKIQNGWSVRDEDGKEIVYHEPTTNEFAAFGGDSASNAWGKCDFARRLSLLDALIGGPLIIEVRMRLKAIEVNKQFIPTNPLNKNILNKFNDEESADVVFEVGITSQEGGTCKKAFHAHRFILQDGASTLAEMCKPSGGGDSIISLSITDVKPDVFKQMLYYMYGGKLTEEELKANSKEIIDACDKYGVVSLKLQAEVSLVNSSSITIDNMMDNLLYADSKNLALLKEAVMDYIVEKKNDIIGNVSFDNVPGAMITDILTAVARGEQGDDDTNSSINYNTIRVGTLRRMLHDKGLDVDGSREAMIALLKENA